MGSNCASVRQYEKSQAGKTRIGQRRSVLNENRESVAELYKYFGLRVEIPKKLKPHCRQVFLAQSFSSTFKRLWLTVT